MNQADIDLGRRALACPQFPRPIKRDQPHPGWRDGEYRDDVGILWRLDSGYTSGNWLPVLADAATAGVLLLMVRKAWGGVVWCVPSADGTGWRVERYSTGPWVGAASHSLLLPSTHGANEVIALVMALEAAPVAKS